MLQWFHEVTSEGFFHFGIPYAGDPLFLILPLDFARERRHYELRALPSVNLASLL